MLSFYKIKKFQGKSKIKTSTKDRTDMEISIPELGSIESGERISDYKSTHLAHN